MKLDINFDNSLEEIINLNPQLADWFERNQETMAYFEMTQAGCLHFENNFFAHPDIVALGRMTNASLYYLESKRILLNSAKAKLAAIAVSNVYEREKERMSDEAKELYYIDYPKSNNKSSVSRKRTKFENKVF